MGGAAAAAGFSVAAAEGGEGEGGLGGGGLLVCWDVSCRGVWMDGSVSGWVSTARLHWGKQNKTKNARAHSMVLCLYLGRRLGGRGGGDGLVLKVAVVAGGGKSVYPRLVAPTGMSVYMSAYAETGRGRDEGRRMHIAINTHIITRSKADLKKVQDFSSPLHLLST